MSYAPGEPNPAWHYLLVQFQDPLVYLLLFAVIISLVIWCLVSGGSRGLAL
jgi:hypothetical protein